MRTAPNTQVAAHSSQCSASVAPIAELDVQKRRLEAECATLSEATELSSLFVKVRVVHFVHVVHVKGAFILCMWCTGRECSRGNWLCASHRTKRSAEPSVLQYSIVAGGPTPLPKCTPCSAHPQSIHFCE